MHQNNDARNPANRKPKPSPNDHVRGPKYPKGVAVSQDMRDTLQKFNVKGPRVD